MQLDRNDYWSIGFDQAAGVVSILWTERTAEMTGEDFKNGLRRLAGFAEEKAARNVLVDVRAFRHAVGDDIGPWRAQEIVPRYNAAGVVRFAYLTGPGGPPVRAPAKLAAGEDFLTGFFDDEAALEAWFASD